MWYYLEPVGTNNDAGRQHLACCQIFMLMINFTKFSENQNLTF
jgi:hypothetical protein